MSLKSSKILTSKDEIMNYMKVGEVLFYHFISLKLPAYKINGKWYAHTDNLEEWFKTKTKVQGSIDIEQNPKK